MGFPKLPTSKKYTECLVKGRLMLVFTAVQPVTVVRHSYKVIQNVSPGQKNEVSSVNTAVWESLRSAYKNLPEVYIRDIGRKWQNICMLNSSGVKLQSYFSEKNEGKQLLFVSLLFKLDS